MQKIAESLTKKGGIKQVEKVHERVGKLKQKYPSIARYFNIEVTVQELAQDKEKGKKKETQTEKFRIATAISWALKQDVDINTHRAVYFLRTSLTDNSWKPFAILQYYTWDWSDLYNPENWSWFTSHISQKRRKLNDTSASGFISISGNKHH